MASADQALEPNLDHVDTCEGSLTGGQSGAPLPPHTGQSPAFAVLLVSAEH